MIIAFLFIVVCLVVLLDFDRSEQSFLCRVAAADTPQFFPLIVFLLFFANQKWISHLLRESDSRNAVDTVDHQRGSGSTTRGEAEARRESLTAETL